MLDFEAIYKKHGETFVWAILENWERSKGIPPKHTMTLEDRWEQFLRSTEVYSVAA